MRLIITLIALISFDAFSCSNEITISNAQKAIAKDKSAKVGCMGSNEECLCYDSVDWEAAEIVDEMREIPVYEKAQAEACVDDSDCQLKLEAKICEQGFSVKNLEFMEVYCAVLIRTDYEPTGKKKLINDPVKLAAVQQQRQAKAQLEAATEVARKAQACGREVMALMLVRNAAKSLTKAQRKKIVTDNSVIKNLLESGSLEAAKDDILATTADGVLVTQEDKQALSAKIDECKP